MTASAAPQTAAPVRTPIAYRPAFSVPILFVILAGSVFLLLATLSTQLDTARPWKLIQDFADAALSGDALAVSAAAIGALIAVAVFNAESSEIRAQNWMLCRIVPVLCGVAGILETSLAAIGIPEHPENVGHMLGIGVLGAVVIALGLATAHAYDSAAEVQKELARRVKARVDQRLSQYEQRYAVVAGRGHVVVAGLIDVTAVTVVSALWLLLLPDALDSTVWVIVAVVGIAVLVLVNIATLASAVSGFVLDNSVPLQVLNIVGTSALIVLVDGLMIAAYRESGPALLAIITAVVASGVLTMLPIRSRGLRWVVLGLAVRGQAISTMRAEQAWAGQQLVEATEGSAPIRNFFKRLFPRGRP